MGLTFAGVRYSPTFELLVGRPAGEFRPPSRALPTRVCTTPFGLPSGSNGASTVQSYRRRSQIVSRTASGPRLSLDVGPSGHERYGSCLARLAQPHLRGGYLPILETSYVDADGVRYRQGALATRLRRAQRALVSFPCAAAHRSWRRSEVRRCMYVPAHALGRPLGRAARARRLVCQPGRNAAALHRSSTPRNGRDRARSTWPA